MRTHITAIPVVLWPAEVLAQQANPAAAPIRFFDSLISHASKAAKQLSLIVERFHLFPSQISEFFEQLAATGLNSGSLLITALLYLSVGVLAELAFRSVSKRIYSARSGPVTWGHRMAWLSINLIGLCIFAIVGGWPLLMSVEGNAGSQYVVATYLTAIVGVRAFAIFLRFVLAPFMKELRFVRLSDSSAYRLYLHSLLIAAAAIFFMVTATLFQTGGMKNEAILTFVLLTRTLIGVSLIIAFFANRSAIAAMLRHGADDRPRSAMWNSFANGWPYLASLYVAFSWFGTSILLLLERFEANSLAVISFCMLCLVVVVALILEEWVYRVDRRSQARGVHADMPSYARFFARLGLALMTTITVLFLTRLWSVPWEGLANEKLATFMPALTQLAVTLFFSFVLWQLVVITSKRALLLNGGKFEGGDAIQQTRISTLLPLIRNVTLIAIAIIASMIALSAFGVDVLPLFASAGVIGLALGLGSQTLVKDVVSGAFFLLDDAFRVGDYVDTGHANGTVERAGIRSLQLRHHLGALHTVPFSEIKTIANHSRGWVILKIDFPVPFETDTDMLRRKFKTLGQDLLKDETNGALFIEPLKSSGVIGMDDNALIMRVSFKARPGDQFILRRVVYESVRNMLRESGIDVAVREVRVRSADNNLPSSANAAVLSDLKDNSNDGKLGK